MHTYIHAHTLDIIHTHTHTYTHTHTHAHTHRYEQEQDRGYSSQAYDKKLEQAAGRHAHRVDDPHRRRTDLREPPRHRRRVP